MNAASLPSAVVAQKLSPAVVPRQYLALKRRLMRGRESEFASLRRLDLRMRLCEVVIFSLLWVGGAMLALSALALPSGSLRLIVQAAGIFVGGVSLNVFFMLVHEGMHSVLFKSRQLNYWGAVLFAAPLFFSYTAFRVLHLKHHRYLGEIDDPDEYKFYAKNPFSLWALHYFRITLAPYIYVFVIPLFAFRHATIMERLQILREYALLMGIYIFLFSQIPLSILLAVWILPACFTAYLIGLWGLTQHVLTDASDPLLASRSVHAHPVVAFCFIYENYHLEHHLFPEIPSYHLKRIHSLIWNRLPHALTVNSYLGFLVRFIFASIKLDERPIGLVELTGWEI